MQIEDAARVHVHSTGLAYDQRHVLELTNVGHREDGCQMAQFVVPRNGPTQKELGEVLICYLGQNLPEPRLVDDRKVTVVNLATSQGLADGRHLLLQMQEQLQELGHAAAEVRRHKAILGKVTIDLHAVKG